MIVTDVDYSKHSRNGNHRTFCKIMFLTNQEKEALRILSEHMPDDGLHIQLDDLYHHFDQRKWHLQDLKAVLEGLAKKELIDLHSDDGVRLCAGASASQKAK